MTRWFLHGADVLLWAGMDYRGAGGVPGLRLQVIGAQLLSPSLFTSCPIERIPFTIGKLFDLD